MLPSTYAANAVLPPDIYKLVTTLQNPGAFMICATHIIHIHTHRHTHTNLALGTSFDKRAVRNGGKTLEEAERGGILD